MSEREGDQGDPEAVADERTIPSLKDTGEDMTPEEKARKTESPEQGYPAGERAAEPYGDEVPSKEHPEDIGSTPSDAEGAEDVTESPGGPPRNPETG